MNRRSTLIALTSAVLSMVAVVPAFSWNHPSASKVEIPFAFTAGGAALPAGSYIVAPYEIQGVVSLTSEEGKRRVLLLTRPGHGIPKEDSGKLVFQRVGSTSALAEVWLPGGLNSYELPTPAGKPIVVALASW